MLSKLYAVKIISNLINSVNKHSKNWHNSNVLELKNSLKFAEFYLNLNLGFFMYPILICEHFYMFHIIIIIQSLTLRFVITTRDAAYSEINVDTQRVQIFASLRTPIAMNRSVSHPPRLRKDCVEM